MEKPKLYQEINLMPYHQEVHQPDSPYLEVEKVLRDQGDTEILGDNPKEEIHNISFDESQHRVVQSYRVSNPDDHTSLMNF